MTSEPIPAVRHRLDHFLRYHDLLSLASLGEGGRVLEVGSGSVGVGEFYAGHFVAIDVNFERPVQNMLPVRGSATNLPFEDRSFDVVISSDMLEHLPAVERAGALKELIRVSRGRVVVGFPQGSPAYRADATLARVYGLRRRTPPDWLQEHLANGLPERDQMEAVVEETGHPCRVYTNESVFLHQSVMIAGALPLLGRFLPVLAVHFRAISVLLLKATRMMGPAYRSIFVIQCDDRGIDLSQPKLIERR